MLQLLAGPSFKSPPQVLNYSYAVSGGGTFTQDFTIAAVGPFAFIKCRGCSNMQNAFDTVVYAEFTSATNVRVTTVISAYGGPGGTVYAQFEVVDPNNCKSRQVISGGSNPVAITPVNPAKTEAFLGCAQRAYGNMETSFSFTATSMSFTRSGSPVTPSSGLRIYLVERI
jgi:hypothetical protein